MITEGTAQQEKQRMLEKPWFHYPHYPWTYKTAIVIGAGIAGNQIARHLAERDWKVTLIECNEWFAPGRSLW